MRVRSYTVQDFEALCKIERSSFSDAWSERMMEDDVSSPTARYAVAEDGGELIGYIGCRLICDEAEIMKIAVIPSRRREGIGEALLSYAVAEAKDGGAACLLLEVREHNEAARRLYEKNGFIVYHRRNAYYSDGEDAVLYRKTL